MNRFIRSGWMPDTIIIIVALLLLTSSVATFSHVRVARASATPEATPTTDSPHAKTFADARLQATTQFELDILADNLITHAEYQEAVDRLLDCLHQAGYDTSAEPSQDTPGMYIYLTALPETNTMSTPEAEAAFQEFDDTYVACSIGTTIVIESTYSAVFTNPTNADATSLVVACLKLTDVAPSDYTVNEFETNFAQQDGTFPFDQTDPRFGSCVNNPNQTGLPDQITEPDARMLPPSDWDAATPVATPIS